MPDAELLIASPEEAAVDREGFTFGGLDAAKLGALGAILEGGAAWVDVASPPLLASLAELPALEEDDFEALAARWQGAADFQGWDAEDVVFLLQQIGELAAAARLQGKTLLLRQAQKP